MGPAAISLVVAVPEKGSLGKSGFTLGHKKRSSMTHRTHFFKFIGKR